MNFLQFVLMAFRMSAARAFEYDALEKFEFSGKIIDLGGHSKADYLPRMRGSFDVTSINIDASLKPSIVGDITKPFPFKDGSFDMAVSLNTLEHVFEHEKVFSETFRALRKGGSFVFAVPFLYRIHGSPDDYWRYSRSALEKLLEKQGFEGVRIVPLGKGLFVATYSLICNVMPFFVRPFFAGWAYLLDTMFLALSRRYRKACGPESYPLGYFVIASKP